MRRSSFLLLAVVLAGTAAPETAAAQTRTCQQVLPADARRIINARGQELAYFRDPVRWLCSGGLRLEADSAVMNRAAGTVTLVGNVVFQDTVRRLESEWANYLGDTDQLLARGAVVLTDLKDGAVVTGEELNYLRSTEERPEARAVVTGRRPHAYLPPGADTEGDGAGPGEPSDSGPPTEIWATRMELLGEEFLAVGDVELERGQVRGAADTARFDQRQQVMTLTGSAHVEDPEYRLEGRRIDAFLEGDALREVLSLGDARLAAEALTVSSEQVRVSFTDGRVERLEAWNPDPETASRRARANAEGFRLRADSIDARADSLGLRVVTAVGRAYGERAADSVALPAPASLRHDWIQGDTIFGYFEHETPADDQAASDSASTVLERIEVAGGDGPALSLYRMEPEAQGDRPAINFMKANRIVLFMERGDLARVQAVGPIEGLYLDPTTGRPTNAEAGREAEARPPPDDAAAGDAGAIARPGAGS